MLCSACNKAVHSRYTLALGKAWHTYHFCCVLCRVVLAAEDNYLETSKGVTCGDCSKAESNNGSSASVTSANVPTENNGKEWNGTGGDTQKSLNNDDTPLSPSIDIQEMYSDAFLRKNYHFRSASASQFEDRMPTSRDSSNSLDSYFTNQSPRSGNNDAQSDASSDIQSDVQSDTGSTLSDDSQTDSTIDTRSGNTQNEDASVFSSEFYKRSFYYRKTLSLDTGELPSYPKSTAASTDRTPNPSPTATGLRGRRLSKYGKTQLQPESTPHNDALPETNSEEHNAPKQFSDTFYKRPQNPKSTRNKKFDFEFRDPSSPSSNSPETSSSPSSDSNTLFKLLDEHTFPEALLDTSDDMKARNRGFPTIGARKPPPSMSIRVLVPAPYVKKPDPPPGPSPSPPLSLPSSPSPPPPSPSASLVTPPSSPKFPRKPQQAPYTSSNYLQVPPVLTPPLARSGSPPLSLPAVPKKDSAQTIRAKIEEEVIRSVMDVPLGSTSDVEKNYSLSNVSSGSSSSSLLAKKRRLKQAHKEATLQRQLSLRKNLVLEVVAAKGGANLRKMIPTTGPKSNRQELLEAVRSFTPKYLRKATTVETKCKHSQHMRAIKTFSKSNKRLRQAVGKTAASVLLPTVTNLVWKGKNCFGVTMRDIQYLLRDPVASKDISKRLALRYRGSSQTQGDSLIGEIDCIVAIPHEAAISFASRLSMYLQVPMQILQQRPCKKTNTKTTVTFVSGRGLFAAGVETLQSRGVEEYELWLTQRNCVRPHARCVVIDDVLDNGSPMIAATMVLRAAGAQVLEMVAVLEYMGFGGREKISQTCANIGMVPPPGVHACLVFNDNPDMK